MKIRSGKLYHYPDRPEKIRLIPMPELILIGVFVTLFIVVILEVANA